MKWGFIDSGSIPVLEKAIAFTQLRHRQIINNIANADTPFYTAKDLPVEEFQKLLKGAIQRRSENPSKPFELGSSGKISVDELGYLAVRPVKACNTGALRHDENDVSIDIEMAKLSANVLLHNSLVELLRKKFEGIQTAISGRLT